MKRVLPLLALLLAVSSCVTFHDVSVQTLARPELEMRNVPRRLQLLIKEGYFLSSTIETQNDKEIIDSMMLNAMNTLSMNLNGNNRYAHTYISIDKCPDEGFPARNDYSTLFDKYKVDQIALVDSVFVSDDFTYDTEDGFSFVVYEVNTAVRWNILDKGLSVPYDVKISYDTLKWICSGADVAEAIQQIPTRADAFWDMGIEIADKYTPHISPMWQNEDRTLLCIGGGRGQIAVSEFSSGRTQEAERLWTSQLSGAKPGLSKAWLYHNLSVCYEVNDDLEKALEYNRMAQTEIDGVDKSPFINDYEMEQIKQTISLYGKRLSNRLHE